MNELIFLSVVCALISTTVAESFVFRKFRRAIAARYGYTAEVGINCAYCVAHWVAFGLVLIEVGVKNPMFYLECSFFVAWLAIFQWAILKALLKVARIELTDER